eukprot:TRINITY_DN31_c0_g1_i5.p1 TRINITY_DN31_c0_g1~~TRINITY_DN31_c0_g1_i5.p1  ORF type:complete len:5496 (+),score=1512.71 TRINITY_DN31_c0_g1_i5:107-16489(+)
MEAYDCGGGRGEGKGRGGKGRGKGKGGKGRGQQGGKGRGSSRGEPSTLGPASGRGAGRGRGSSGCADEAGPGSAAPQQQANPIDYNELQKQLSVIMTERDANERVREAVNYVFAEYDKELQSLWPGVLKRGLNYLRSMGSELSDQQVKNIMSAIIGHIRAVLRDFGNDLGPRKNSRTLQATAVAIACDAITERHILSLKRRAEKTAAYQANHHLVDAVRKKLMVKVAEVLQDELLSRHIPERVWEWVASFGNLLVDVNLDAREHLLRTCRGENSLLAEALQAGAVGARGICRAVELATCVDSRGGRAESPTWSSVMKQFPDWRVDLLGRAQDNFGSVYLPDSVSKEEFHVLVREFASGFTAGKICTLVRAHKDVCSDLFDEDLASIINTQCWDCKQQPSHQEFVDFFRYVAFPHFPPAAQQQAVRMRIDALLAAEDEEGIRNLGRVCTHKETAHTIAQTANDHIRRVTPHLRNLGILARVLHSLASSGTLDLREYFTEKQQTAAPGLLLGLIGKVFSMARGSKLLDGREVLRLLLSAAEARAKGQDCELVLAVLAVLSEPAALQWTADAADCLRLCIRDFLNKRNCFEAHPAQIELTAKEFLNANVRAALPAHGAGLFELVWELLAERIATSTSVTGSPVLQSVQELDKWMFTEPWQHLLEEGSGSRGRAAVSLLRAYFRCTGMPFCQPRRFPLPLIYEPFRRHKLLKKDCELFGSRVERLVGDLKAAIREKRVSKEQMAHLSKLEEAHRAALAFDGIALCAHFKEAKERLQSLDVVLRSLEQEWKVCGLTLDRQRVEAALSDEQFPKLELASLNVLADDVTKHLPQNYTPKQLEQAASSPIFMAHWGTQGGRLDIAAFKGVLENILGKKGALRELKPSTTIANALKSLPMDDRPPLQHYEGLVPAEHREMEKDFLCSMGGCSRRVAESLVDDADQLVALTYHLRYFREWEAGRLADSLQLRDGFFLGAAKKQKLLRRTVKDVGDLPLSKAATELRQLRAVTNNCSQQALRLLGSVLQCPGLVSFVQEHPQTLAVFLNQVLTTSRSPQQASFKQYSFLVPYLLPVVASCHTFDRDQFANIQGRNPIQALCCDTFFALLSNLQGLDDARADNERESSLQRITYSIQSTANKQVLDRLKQRVGEVIGVKQMLRKRCEAHQTARIEIEMPVTGRPELCCHLHGGDTEDTGGEVLDLAAYKDTMARVTLMYNDDETVQRFLRVAKSIIGVYDMVCQLSEEGHIEFRGRRMCLQVDMNEGDLPEVISVLQRLCREWSTLLDEAVRKSNPLSILSAAELVRMADLWQIPSRSRGAAGQAEEQVLQEGWHIAAGMGAAVSRDCMLQILSEQKQQQPQRGGRAQVEAGPDALQLPANFEERVSAVSRSRLEEIGNLLSKLLTAAGMHAGIDSVRCVRNFDGDGGGRLKDITRIAVSDRRPYALSLFRTAELRPQHWLECCRGTTLEQVRTFCRRFEDLLSGRMGVLHFQELRTELQNMLRDAPPNTADKQLLLFITADKGGLCSRAERINALCPQRTEEIHKKVVQMRRFRSVTYFGGAAGTGKTTTIALLVSESHIDAKNVVRIHIHATTSVTDICRKLLAAGPWGAVPKPEEEGRALVIDVSHDADPVTVNTVLDELVLFGKLCTPSGLCCSAAVWSGWDVYIELQEASKSWQERINLLQVSGLVTDGRSLLMPFKLDLADPRTGRPQHPGAVDAMPFIREHFEPAGGWQPSGGDANVAALTQLVRTSGAAASHRNLARAAKFLAKCVPELQECPFFAFHEDAPAGDGHFVTKRDIGGMLAKCTVHGLRQHLKPGGEDHLHMCTGVGGFNCMLFGGSAPADIEHDAARTGIKVTRAQQGAAGGRSMPLYKLVDMLSAVSGVKSQKITQSLLGNNYILTTDFLSKMVQQLLRAALGDLCILQGPSGTGKTACTLQTASLEPQSGNHPHNNLPRQLANFLRGEDLKQHFRDGNPPAAMAAEDVAKAAIPGVGTAELDEGKAELESKGQLSDFLNTVLNRSDWAVLHHVLDGLAGLATSGADQVLGDDEDAPPPEQPPAAAPPVAGAAAAALGESDGAAGADARDGGAAKPAGGVSTRKPRITSSAIDQIRSALFHVLDPHIKSDSELELAMAESLPGVDGRLGEKLKAVREDPERREQLYLGELRPLLELLHPNCCLTAADPVTTDRCVDAIKKITGCLVSGKTTFLSAAVLHVLTSRMSEVLARIPVPKAETLRRTLQKDQVDAALRCWGAKALERMGDAAQAGVAAIAKWMTGIIEKAPLAKPTARFLELTRGAVPVASLPELLSEFVKTGAHDNHLVVLMRFDMDESELYEQMRPILERARLSAELYPDSPLHFVVFIDEANTSKSTGLLKHIMLDRKWDMCPGGKIPSNISFVAAINPAKRDDYLEGGEEHVASGYSDGDGDAEDEEGTDCMHDVNAFPPAFDHAIVPWRQLVGPGRDEFVTTKLYTNETVFSNQLSARVIKALKDIVLTAHDFVQRLYRRKRARSTVSQRDIHRTFKLFDWFFARPDACTRDAIGRPETKARDAMILAVAVSYYFRLRPADRFHLAAKVDRAVEKSGAFDAQPLEELLAYVIDRYFIEMTHDAWLTGIFEHPPLRQNLFVQLVCFENRLAVVLHGPPGTSKTLSNNIVQDTMTGRNHFMAQFHQVGDVVRYQGSRQSAAAHIRKKCEECEENQRRYDDVRARRLSLLNIDEAGIVHSGDPMVLKVLHYYLGQAKFAAVLMTHDPLDTAVSNRCVEVRLTEPTPEELEYIACGIVRVNGVETLEETMRVLKALSRAYYKLREHGKLGKDLRRWYGLRDFYHLVRFFLRNEDRDGRVQPRKDQRCAVRITPRMLLEGLERNFNGPSGKKDSSNLFEAVMEEFQKQCSDLRPEWRAFGLHRDVLLDPRRRRNVVEVVANSLADNNRARGDSQSNMSDMWVRFKLLVDETPDGSLLSLLQQCGLPEFRNIKVISLSDLSQDEFHSVSVVQEISAAMEAGITVWLTNTREIDGSLFDLFSQSYTVCNGQDGQVLSFVPLGVGGVVEWKRVRENFQIIVHVMRSEVPLLPPPFLNRLEKFPVGTADVLAYRMGQIRRQGEQAPDEAEWSAEEMEAARQHAAEQLAEIKWLRKRCSDFVDAISYSAPTVASDTVYSKDLASTIDSIVLGCIGVGPDGAHLLRDPPDSRALRSLIAHGVQAHADTPAGEARNRRKQSCLAQILEISRPEGVLLAKDALARAPAYRQAYFKDMAPCSLARLVRRLLQDCREAESGSWECYMVHVPSNADFYAVLEGVHREQPELSVMPFDTIASREHLDAAITSFAQNDRSRAFAVAVGGASDVAIREMLQLMSTRPEDCSGPKTVLLVRPFRPELFRTSFAPQPGGGRRHVYADASPDTAETSLATYAAVGEKDPEVSAALFHTAMENALRDLQMPAEDRLPTGNEAFTGAAAQMYSPQATGRAGFCRDLFTKFPRTKKALQQSFQRITGSEERYDYARRQALMALCDQAPQSLAQQLQEDRSVILQNVCYLVIHMLLEDCTAATLIRAPAALRPQLDCMLEHLVLSSQHCMTADELRRMSTADRPVTASGVLPYLPGFRSLRRLLTLDSSLDPERAAAGLRQEWEERKTADPNGREAIAAVEKCKPLFEFFEKDCVLQCIHSIPPGTQNILVDATLELMRTVHAEIFGADTERTVWSVLAVCACRAHAFESHALGLLPLAESKALSADSVTKLRRMVRGKPQAELRVELAKWVQELVAMRFYEVSQPDEVQKWSLSVQHLYRGAGGDGVATPLVNNPAAAALAVAAMAVHAENTPAVLQAARDFVKDYPQDGAVNLRGLQLLHEQSPAAAQAAVLHLAQMGCLSGWTDFRDAALLQCAEGRIHRAMTARVVMETGLLPGRGQGAPPPESLKVLWQLAGGTDDSEVPSRFPADGPLSSPLYRALYDILYERLADPADPTNSCEFIANRHQHAVVQLEIARRQGKAPEAAYHSVEVHASGHAYIRALGCAFLSDGPASLPHQGHSDPEELQTAKSLLASQENREAFVAAVARASEETGGARQFLARFLEPDADARLRSLSEDMGPICGGVKVLPKHPSDWIFRDSVAPHAAELARAVDGAAQAADAAAAAQLLNAAVAKTLPAGVGVVRALLAWLARGSRANGRPLPAALASDPALAAALELDPAAHPGVQNVLTWCFAGAGGLPAVEECGIVDITGQPGANDWVVDAESVLCAALQQPGTMLHHMLCDQARLRGTIIAGDVSSTRLEHAGDGHRGYFDCYTQIQLNGSYRYGAPRKMDMGACYLIHFVEFTLMAFGAMLNPPAAPNSPQDVLWQEVFSHNADRSSYKVNGHNARRIFLDFILERSQACHMHLVTTAGLGTDSASRLVALFCQRLVQGDPLLAPLQQSIDSRDKKDAAERAVQAFWEEATANDLAALRMPADGLCDTLRLANEVIERSKGDHIPEPRAAQRAFTADAAAKEACPCLRIAHDEERMLQCLPRLLVLGVHLHDWVHTHLSGSVKEKDYKRPLRAFTHEFDTQRGVHSGADGSVTKLYDDFVESWNVYLDKVGQRNADGLNEKLGAREALARFITLPPGTCVGEHKHGNVLSHALSTLVQDYNRTVCSAAGVTEEDYERTHARLHPRKLSPGKEQSLMLCGASELASLCRSYSRGPGEWDWQQADREVRRQVGEDLPLLRLPDPVVFRWCSAELGEAASTECARGLRAVLAQNKQPGLMKCIPEGAMNELSRFTHRLSCESITALAAAVQKVFTDPQRTMLPANGLRHHVDEALDRAGVQGEVRTQRECTLSDAVGGLEVAHIGALAELLAGKLESHAWKHADMPVEMAQPMPTELHEKVQQRLRDFMRSEPQLTDSLRCLLEYEKIMSDTWQPLSGVIGDPSVAEKPFGQWLSETKGVTHRIEKALEGARCKHFVELLRLLQRQRAEAEEASRDKRHRVEWCEDGGDAPGDQVEEDEQAPGWRECSPEAEHVAPEDECEFCNPAETPLLIDAVRGDKHPAVPWSTMHRLDSRDPLAREYDRWDVEPYWLEGYGGVVYHRADDVELWAWTGDFDDAGEELQVTVADAMRHSDLVGKALWHLAQCQSALDTSDTSTAELQLREARLPDDLHGLMLFMHEACCLAELNHRAGEAALRRAVGRLTELRNADDNVRRCTPGWPCDDPRDLLAPLKQKVNVAAEQSMVPAPGGGEQRARWTGEPVDELLPFVKKFLDCEEQLRQLTEPAPVSPMQSLRFQGRSSYSPSQAGYSQGQAAAAPFGSIAADDAASVVSRPWEAGAPPASPAPPPAEPPALPAAEARNYEEVFTWLQTVVKLDLGEREAVVKRLDDEDWDGAEVANLGRDTIAELLGVVGLKANPANRRKLVRFVRAPSAPAEPPKLPAAEAGNYDEVYTWLQEDVKLQKLGERETVVSALKDGSWDGAEVAELSLETIEELIRVVGLKPTGPKKRRLARFASK